MRTLLWKIKFRKFEEIFGFKPTPLDGDPNVLIAEQAVVEVELSKLASSYQMADRNEQLAVSSLKKVVNAKELLAGRESLGWHQDGVRMAKDSFWEAWRLAKKAGFDMKPKYTDYLPQGLDRYL